MVRSLLLLGAISLLVGCATELPPAAVNSSLPVVVVKVDSISCEGCCGTIKEELAALPGVKHVEADPETKLVSVQVADANFDSKILTDRLKEIKYDSCNVVKDVNN